MTNLTGNAISKAVVRGTGPLLLALVIALLLPLLGDLSGSLGGPSLQSSVAQAAESRVDMIKRLYRQILGREADQGGLNAYNRSGMSEQQIRDSLLNSTECRQGRGGECARRHGQQNNNARLDMIKRLYREVFGREADQGGLNAYNRSGMSEQQIRDSLLNSAECRQGRGGECARRHGQQNNNNNPGRVQLNVPYVSQLTQAWEVDGNGKRVRQRLTGQNNCGPAAVAMAIQMYRGTGAITLNDAAVAIRGSNSDIIGGNSPTNFKSAKTIALLNSKNLTAQDVRSFEEMQRQLQQGRPVIVLVDNSKYIRTENNRAVPYDNTSAWVQDHIVVVTGYDKDNVYINDPLAYTTGGQNFRVPIAAFQSAAGAKGWFASAIVPK